MASIYLLNVGANASSVARSPVFANGSFVFVPFNVSDDLTQVRPYPEPCKEFVRPTFRDLEIAHDDPDWTNKTYGDCLIQSRSSNLRKVEAGDILLFWGRLWPHAGKGGWSGFRQAQVRKVGNNYRTGAYLIGALRVRRKVRAKTTDLSADELRRLQVAIQYPPCYHDVVFLGEDNPIYSGLFPKAVSLEENECPNGLLYRCFRKEGGSEIERHNWMGALRSCRKVLEADTNERTLALARAIYSSTEGRFDILSGIVNWTKPDQNDRLALSNSSGP
jgi:hypothetical protein